MTPRRLALSGGLLLAIPGAWAAEHAPVAATPISRMDTPWWRQRHLAVLERVRQGRVELLWVGDSITQDWENAGPEPWNDFAMAWQRYYGDRHAVNLGFKGDNTAHLLWRLRHGEVDGIAPRAVVLLIGANNMGRVHWNAPQTVAGIDACVAELRSRLPGAKILLLAVLPSIRSDYVTATTAQVNRALAASYGAGSDPAVSYMDVGALLMRDGKVDPSQYYDGLLTPPESILHPTAQAQARIAEAIEPTLARLLGVPSRARQAD